MSLDEHIVQHLQVLLTVWFIVMLGYTSDVRTKARTRMLIKWLNYLLAGIVIALSFHPNFH